MTSRVPWSSASAIARRNSLALAALIWPLTARVTTSACAVVVNRSIIGLSFEQADSGTCAGRVDRQLVDQGLGDDEPPASAGGRGPPVPAALITHCDDDLAREPFGRDVNATISLCGQTVLDRVGHDLTGGDEQVVCGLRIDTARARPGT